MRAFVLDRKNQIQSLFEGLGLLASRKEMVLLTDARREEDAISRSRGVVKSNNRPVLWHLMVRRHVPVAAPRPRANWIPCEQGKSS